MIIFISGSINCGKSTVSKLLQEKLGNVALIEIDSLREFIEWMPLEQAIPLNLKNAVSIINNFVAEGLDVIVSYPLSEKNYNYLRENLDVNNLKIITITLAPRLEIALQNRGSRELTDREKERIRYHYEIGINNPSFGEVIDNSDQSPMETLSKILEIINASQG
jgi:adenylate kinase family enzyme